MFRRVVLWGTAMSIVVGGALPLVVQADTINPPLPDTPEATAPLKRAISISQPREFSSADRKKDSYLGEKGGRFGVPRSSHHARARKSASL